MGAGLLHHGVPPVPGQQQQVAQDGGGEERRHRVHRHHRQGGRVVVGNGAFVDFDAFCLSCEEENNCIDFIVI